MGGIAKNKNEFDKEAFLKALGRQIKTIREQKGLTAAEFSRLAFMETSNVARLETGRTNPTATTLKIICNVLDIEMEELFAGFR